MGVEAQYRPSVVVPATGVLMVGLSVALLVGPESNGPWFAVAVGAAGAGLAVWGFARLRRARAARPDQSWWGLLRADLIALGVAVFWLPIWVALPDEQRDGLVRFAQEVFEMVHLARGHP